MILKPIGQIAALCWAGVIALTLCGPACAGEKVVNYSGKTPSKEEIVNKLRGISLGSTTAAAGAAGATAIQPQKVSFDQITFEFNSDKITAEAKDILDRVGQALSDRRMDGQTFLIEGHTDAVGSLPYNIRLSHRRAESVKRYLMDNYHIGAARLKTAGKGPTDLMDKQHPDSGVNRRVVFGSANL